MSFAGPNARPWERGFSVVISKSGFGSCKVVNRNAPKLSPLVHIYIYIGERVQIRINLITHICVKNSR